MRDYALPASILVLAAAVFIHAIAPAHAEEVASSPTCLAIPILPAVKAEAFMKAQAEEGKKNFAMSAFGDQMVVCAW